MCTLSQAVDEYAEFLIKEEERKRQLEEEWDAWRE